MKLREVMATAAYCASPATRVAEVAQQMKRYHVGAIPVCLGERLVGILTDRAVAVDCLSSGLDPGQVEARELMAVEPLTGRPDMDLEEALAAMGKEQVTHLAVVEGGRLVGMVALGDLVVNIADDGMVARALRLLFRPALARRPGAICPHCPE